MATVSLKDEIDALLDQLSPDQQRQVLDLAMRLTRPRGETGKQFIERTRSIKIASEELEQMQKAIDDAFERVDPGEWELPA